MHTKGQALLTLLLALLLVGLIFVTQLPVASANTGITVSFDSPRGTHNGMPVLQSGDEIKIKVQIDRGVAAGTTNEIELVGPVTPYEGDLVASCSLIERAWVENGVIKIKTVGNYDATLTQQCDFTLKARVDEVTLSEEQTAGWKYNGQTVTNKIVVTKKGDVLEPEAGKGSSAGKIGATDFNINDAISVTDGVVSVSDSLIGKPVSYTINFYSIDGFTGEIIDTIEEPLKHIAGSFTAVQHTWDANGLNRTTTNYTFPSAVSINGQVATIPVNVPARSELKITYSAKIEDAAGLEKLREVAQAVYDAKKNHSVKKTFPVGLGNTIDIRGAGANGGNLSGSTSVSMGSVGVPGTLNSSGLSKSVNNGTEEITTAPAADGTLATPVPVTYLLTANIKYNRESGVYTNQAEPVLTENVVVVDTLPSYASWDITDPAFVTSNNNYRLATGVECTFANMKQDAQVRTYCVSGNTFIANFGKQDAVDTGRIWLKAKINSVAGLQKFEDNSVSPAIQRWRPNNTARFYFEGESVDRSRSMEIYYNPSTTAPPAADDSSAFDKKAAEVVKVTEGSAINIPYSFYINPNNVAGSQFGLPQLVVSDQLDTSVIDISDTQKIIRSVQGYWKQGRDLEKKFNLSSGSLAATLNYTNFETKVTPEGLLTIRMTESGFRNFMRNTSSDRKLDLQIELTLPVRQDIIGEREVLRVNNRANLTRTDGRPLNTADTFTILDSYGNEVSVEKQVRDREARTWVESTRVKLNPDKTPVDPYAVYRLNIEAHHDYNSAILPIADLLPPEVEFVGFTTDTQIDVATPATSATINTTKGNLTATFDAATKEVRVQQRSSTFNRQAGVVGINFVVRYKPGTQLEEGKPIVNVVGSSAATITPGNDYPLTIRKTDTTDSSTKISDTRALFRIYEGPEADANILVDNIFVEDGFLRVRNAAGESVNVTVREAGTYYVREVRAPRGYQRSDAVIPVRVTTTGGSAEVTFPNTPGGITSAAITLVKRGINCDTNQTTCELAGANFAIYDQDPATAGATALTNAVNADPNRVGYFVTTELSFGTTYWLVETVAPRGHQLLAKPIAFELSEDGITVLNDTALTTVITNTETQKGYTLAISDPTKTSLPTTGGNGYKPALLIATLLFALALGNQLYSQRKVK